jgi:hypothetical protein
VRNATVSILPIPCTQKARHSIAQLKSDTTVRAREGKEQSDDENENEIIITATTLAGVTSIAVGGDLDDSSHGGYRWV